MTRNRFDVEEKWITRGIYAVWIVTFVVAAAGTFVAIHFIRKFW